MILRTKGVSAVHSEAAATWTKRDSHFVPTADSCSATKTFARSPYDQRRATCVERQKPEQLQEASVVGSISLRTSVILVAGNPLISGCLRIMASSFAR